MFSKAGITYLSVNRRQLQWKSFSLVKRISEVRKALVVGRLAKCNEAMHLTDLVSSPARNRRLLHLPWKLYGDGVNLSHHSSFRPPLGYC